VEKHLKRKDIDGPMPDGDGSRIRWRLKLFESAIGGIRHTALSFSFLSNVKLAKSCSWNLKSPSNCKKAS
jgi:hypothetical protein